MSTLGTTTILGDLTVTGELKASNVSGGVSGNYLPLTGGTLSGELSLVNSYPCIRMDQNGLKARLITDNSHFWVEGTNTGSTTVTSRLSFNLANGELYIKNANSRVYHEGFKPTLTTIQVSDIRDTAPTPDSLANRNISTFFNNHISYGGDWQSGFTVAGWSSGYAVWQMKGYSSTGRDDRWYLRSGRGATWNEWKQIVTNHDSINFGTAGKGYFGANTNVVTTVPSITLAIGDSDTGMHWHSDGNASLYANNQQILNWTTSSITTMKRLTPNAGINRFYAHCQSIGSDYFNTAIELRETNEVGNTQSDHTYAPSLGYHWGNRAAATIAMHSDGHFYFRAQGYTGTQYRNIYCNELRAVRAYNAVWNDYAEFFEKENLEETFEAGDVVIWNKTGVIKSNKENASNVIGVYSDTFGHIVGGDAETNIEDNYDKYVPIGLSGRVNVKLIGKIKVGDLITTSDIEGVAMKAINPQLGTIIGKALEDKDTEEITRIKMLITNT